MWDWHLKLDEMCFSLFFELQNVFVIFQNRLGTKTLKFTQIGDADWYCTFVKNKFKMWSNCEFGSWNDIKSLLFYFEFLSMYY